MKKIIILIIVMIAVSNLFPQNDYNARFLKLKIKYTLKKDGSQVYDYYHRVKLLNTTRGFGESFIKYNPEFQKLEVLNSVTTMADGRKVKTPENGYNEVLPREAKRFVSFSNLKEMVVSHTGIERGAEIEIRYKLTTKAGFIPYFTGKEFLTRNIPVDSFIFELEVPAGTNINYKVFNDSLEPVLKKGDNVVTYFFKKENINPDKGNYYVKNYDKPYLVFSDLQSFKNFLPELKAGKKIPEFLKNKISQIGKDNNTSLEKLSAIKKKIIDNLEDCHVGLRLSGFKTRSMNDIFSSGYATAFEKIIIAKSLLERFNFKYRIASIIPGINPENKLFTYLQSERIYFKVSADGENILFDPLVRGINFNISLSNEIPSVDINSGKILPKESGIILKNQISLNGNLKLVNKKISGKISLKATGIFFNYIEFLKSKDKVFKKTVGKVFPLSKAKNIKVVEVTPHSAVLKGEIEAKPGKLKYEKFLFINSFRIPVVSKDITSGASINYPVTIGSPFLLKVSLNLEIQNDLSVDFIRKNEKVEGNAGLYKLSVKEVKKGLLKIDMNFRLNRSKINPENYSSLKHLLSRALKGGSLLILKKK